MQTTKSIPPVLERYGIQIGGRRDTESQKNIKKFELKLVEFLQATPSIQLSWKLVCFLKWYRITKNIKKIKAKNAKFEFLQVVWPCGEGGVVEKRLAGWDRGGGGAR
jgi:hypothetical protein